MFNTGETLENIEKWAEAKFPHEFKAVKDYLNDNDIIAADWDHKNSRSDVLARSVYVGRWGPIYRPVFAYVTSEEEDRGPCVALSLWDPYRESCNVYRRETDFKEPFSWLNPGTNHIGTAQFDALIQFLCVMPAEVSIDARNFKKHFEGACRVIAGELDKQSRQVGPAATPATSRTPSVTPSPMSEALLTAAPAIFQPAIANLNLTSEPLPASQNQKPSDMEDLLASQKVSLEEFVKKTQAADRQEKDRLLAETTELSQKVAKAEQECKDSKNELLEYKTKLESIEATLSKREVGLHGAKDAAETARESLRKNVEKHKKEVRKVKGEVKRLTGEVEKFKKEAEASTQEATKAKKSLEDFQELEEVFERVQKRRIV